MSVSLMVKSLLHPEQSQEVAIATNATFEKYWIPTAQLLGLALVPQLWDPFYPNETERVALLDELNKIRVWIDNHTMDDPYYSEHMKYRVDDLMRSLKSDTCDENSYCFG